jgi:putative tricarboxylic transport membrane protein
MAHIVASLIGGLGEMLSFPAFLYQLIGIVFGFILGVIPGIGGIFGMALVLPLTFSMKPEFALSLLLGVYAVSTTGGSVTSILFGVPGTAVNVATVFDGYPMAQRGEGARAIGIAMTASGLGGLFGAVILALLIPVLQPLVLAFAPPEFFMLAVLGIVFIAYLGSGAVLKSLVTGGVGLMLSFVGQDLTTGTLRYTFGQLYLWDGVPLVPAVIGLFAIGEMIDLGVRGGSIAQAGLEAKGNPFEGMKDVFRHWGLFLRSSAMGTIIGIIPGLGGVVANFLAYGHAVQTSKDPSRFGKGAPEGVIGPESSNNAKEGGSLVPTLAFGIPGSEAMAILLGAFYILGLQPGPKMLTENLDLVFMMVWILVASNIIGALIGFVLARRMAFITKIRGELIVPVVFVISVFGAYATNNDLGDFLVAIGFGIGGYYLKKHDYSRATLIIGLVLGRIVEKNLLLSIALYGWSMFLRPLTLLFLLSIIVTLIYPLLRGVRRKIESSPPS